MSDERYVIGIDFGTLSGRAVVVRVGDGAEMGSAVHSYPHAVMERKLETSGEPLPRDWALQDPQDYIEVLKHAVPDALRTSDVSPEDVIGVGTDFTASSPLPVRADGTPLSVTSEFADRPHAYVKLWKHHAAQPHADRINAAAEKRGESWLPRYGGKISSEWQFAKALQLLEEDPEVYRAADRWIESADWIVWQLCGRETRNPCSAGFKAIHQDDRYPSTEYLTELNDDFGDFIDKLDGPLEQLGTPAGSLTAEAAGWTGLREGITVAVGNVDAHVTVPAARATAPGHLLAVMGTSTCHVMNGENLAEVPGMCGVVRDGITPGSWGYEAGQSGVGDIFAWFVEHAVPRTSYEAADEAGQDIHTYLSAQAALQQVGEHGLVALDWHSGNRSTLVDHRLSGVVAGLTLATRPEDVYRALVESTAFGTRRIIEAFLNAGLPVERFIVAGGLLENTFLMQVYADVTGYPLDVLDSGQGPALGSAIHAAVAAGAYDDVEQASEAMGKRRESVYEPDPDRHRRYDEVYADYVELYDHFGEDSDLLHRLRNRRDEVLARSAPTTGP
jgi:L-ribulokinase